MKGELLKRFFRAIASSDQEAIDKLTYLVIEEERSKGHTLLADQLENITKKKPALEDAEEWKDADAETKESYFDLSCILIKAALQAAQKEARK